MHELFDFLKSLQLPTGDFAVFGSGPLIVRGIIPITNDLDVICRGSTWEEVQKIGTFDELIDCAEYIEELPFVRLKHVVEYKLHRGSAKDMLHIESLRQSKYFAMINKTD
jgi:hypothetical protein